MRIEACARQDADAEVIRFLFEGARIVELVLCHGGARQRDRRVGTAMTSARKQDGGDKCGHCRARRALGFSDEPRDVPLLHVRDFVRQHSRQLAFVVGREDQACVDAYEAAGHREGVDTRVVNQKKLICLLRVAAVR